MPKTNLPKESTATNELEQAIRFAGKVTNGIQTYSVEGNSVGRLTAKSQDIVEIGIEDLLALFEAQRTRIEHEARLNELKHRANDTINRMYRLDRDYANDYVQSLQDNVTALDGREEKK